MKVTIDLGKLLEFYDEHSESYDLSDGNGFRAFALDFVCSGEKEEEDWNKEDWTDYSIKKMKTDTLDEFGDTYISIVYDNREAAEYVLQKMKDILKERKLVTVADYAFLSNQKPERGMYDLGWTKLNTAYVYSYSCLKDGKEVWGIHFPETLPIEHFIG